MARRPFQARNLLDLPRADKVVLFGEVAKRMGDSVGRDLGPHFGSELDIPGHAGGIRDDDFRLCTASVFLDERER